jgi:hypothetical protein
MAFGQRLQECPPPRGSNLRVHTPRLAASQRALNRYLPKGCRFLDSCTTFTDFLGREDLDVLPLIGFARSLLSVTLFVSGNFYACALE